MVALMTKKQAKVCPQCGRPVSWKGNPHRPFCSERCRLIDLGKWAIGEYRIAGEKAKGVEEKKKEKSSSDEKEGRK